MSHILYVASPIDVAEDATAIAQLRQEINNKARAMGFMVFDPTSAFHAPNGGSEWKHDTRLWRINRSALAQANALLLLLPNGYASTGGGMEVEHATNLGLPVAVLGGWHSWMLAREGVHRFDEQVAALDWLRRKLTREFQTQTSQPLVRFTYSGKHEGERLTRGYADDAGFDLWVEKTTVIPPGEFADVPTGVAVEFPAGYWGWITGRSSTARKRGLMVVNGIIDTGFRGELYVGCWNMTPNEVSINENERIGQVVLMPNVGPRFQAERVTKLAPSARGTNGFGSTG